MRGLAVTIGCVLANRGLKLPHPRTRVTDDRTQARVTVRLKARGTGNLLEYPASTAAATNKLFRAAVFELPEPGWWDVEVVVEGPYGPVFLHFEVKADEPLPRWLELWPWFAWPALAVAFFGLHQVLIRRRNFGRAGTARPA